MAAHWQRLRLIPGAPECVIKAAHRAMIEQHHPDRGGDAATATQINVSYDELRGEGASATEYVAHNYNAEPWVILGITNTAGAAMADRAGKLLVTELSGNRRLIERVRWAVANFDKVQPRQRVAPPPAPSRTTRRKTAQASEAEPTRPGVPEGLPAKIDFGKVQWGSEAARTVQLTWKRFAPFTISVEAESPVRAEVTASKVLPGRFSIAFSIDWEAAALSRGPTVQGYTLDVPVTIRWTASDEITVRAKGLILYPAIVTASPAALDLGTVTAGRDTRSSAVFISSGTAAVTIEPPAWLRRVDGAGRVVEAPLRLAANIPVRVEFRVHWPPILERGSASLAKRRPVRPTGTIVVRWDDQRIEVPAQMVAQPK